MALAFVGMRAYLVATLSVIWVGNGENCVDGTCLAAAEKEGPVLKLQKIDEAVLKHTKTSELMRLAAVAGATPAEIGEALDDERDSKAALLALVIAKEQPKASEGTEDVSHLFVGTDILALADGSRTKCCCNKDECRLKDLPSLAPASWSFGFRPDGCGRLAGIGWHSHTKSNARTCIVSKEQADILRTRLQKASENVTATTKTTISLAITAIALEAQVLTASDDKTARLWNASTGECKQTYRGHSGWVNSAVFSTDGSEVLTAACDGTARIWNTSTGNTKLIFAGHSGCVSSAVFSADGTKVVTAGEDGTARIWNATTGDSMQIIDVCASCVPSVIEKAEQTNQKCRSMSAVFSMDGSKLLTVSAYHAKIWNVPSGKCVQIFSHSRWVRSATFSVDGSVVLTVDDRVASIWDAASGELKQTFGNKSYWTNSAALSTCGLYTLTSDDQIARIWDASSGECKQTFTGHSHRVLSAVFSPTGSEVLTTSIDQTTKIWSTSTGECKQTLEGHSDRVNSAVFSP